MKMLLPSFVRSIEITALLPSIVDKDVVAFTYVCGLLMGVCLCVRGVGSVCAIFFSSPSIYFLFIVSISLNGKWNGIYYELI